MKANNTRRMRRLLALALTICLLSCLAISAFADSENTAVNEAANGTLRFNWYLTPEEGNRILWYSGSCFLINEDTIVTNASCTRFLDDIDFADSGLMEIGMEATGNENFSLEDFMQIYKNEYSVTVTRDVTVNATLVQSSAEMDFAILKLDTPIKNKEVLPLRDSDTVKTTENVYAIGFPSAFYDIQTTSTASSADVTITSGNVIKITKGLNTWMAYNTEIAEMLGINAKDLGYQECDLILSDCQLGGGVLGGPMVDDNGSVIAICEGSYGDKYFYSIPINQVVEVCDALGVEYTNAGAVPEEPAVPAVAETQEPAAVVETPAVDTAALEKAIGDAKAVDAKAYTEASYKSLTDALAVAEGALAAASTQESVDSALNSVNAAVSALEEQKGLSTTTLIIIIVAVAVVAVVVIVVALMSSAKKKNAKKVAAVTSARPIVPPTQPTSAATGPVVGSTATIQAAGETTILGGEAGSTTVLVHGGSLVRVRTGQKVELSSSEITIGRDAKNTYAIKDVSSISRNHAKISIRNRTAYLKDLGAANGTTINGVKLNPNQEQALKDGDKISFAEEEFEYHQ